MFIRRIVLNHFRNYSQIDVNFGLNRIYITGNNGIGKTNILEAIYYLTLGRSFRKACRERMDFSDCALGHCPEGRRLHDCAAAAG